MKSLALNDSGTLSKIRGDLGQAWAYHQQALESGPPTRHRARARRTRWRVWPGALGPKAAPPTRETGAARKALALFQRIGAAEAADVSAELDSLPSVPGPAPASP